MNYRWIYIGLAALAIAVAAVGALLSRGGEAISLPEPIQAVFPGPNDAVIRQTVIEIDLEVGFEADIYVDGFLVPPSETSFVEGTAVYRWAPSPSSLYLSEWSPGTHEVTVVWRSISGQFRTGEFSWTFRVQ